MKRIRQVLSLPSWLGGDLLLQQRRGVRDRRVESLGGQVDSSRVHGFRIRLLSCQLSLRCLGQLRTYEQPARRRPEEGGQPPQPRKDRSAGPNQSDAGAIF